MPGKPRAARQRLAPALVLILWLSACHAQARAPMVQARAASCGPATAIQAALAAALLRGAAPESLPMGQCVANAAHRGSAAAAMLLADVYGRAMVAAQASGGSAAALRLDVFGRHIAWVHMAAERGYPPAQYQLARETDTAAARAMPDTTLAWYQTAAENGSAPALAAIRAAYGEGRIREDRLYDLNSWLSRQTRRVSGRP